MILVDTSVWIDHFRHGNSELAALLEQGDVLTHPFVIGELACGGLKNRREILTLLASLRSAVVATDAEALLFIDTRRLVGKGIGYIDVHLLASAALSDVRLWTLDKKLAPLAR